MFQFCIRHSEQQITHFCSNQLCQQFLSFFCTKCDISHCNKHYHLQPFDNFEHVINKIILPQFDNKQIEYCKQQMNKIITNFTLLQEKVIGDYNDAIQNMIQFIQERSDQFKNEIVSQILIQKQFMEEKLSEFQKTIDKHYNDYQTSYQKAKTFLTLIPDQGVHIEEFYQKMGFNQLQDHFNVLLRMQPEIEILITENSLQITKEQELLQSLNKNVYFDFEDQIKQNSENSLTLLWSKYYQMTYNVHLFDSKSQSIVESEIVENIRFSRGSSQAQSVFSEIDQIIALAQQVKGSNSSSLKLKSQTYGYSKFNLIALGQIKINENHIDVQQKIPPITPYCILAIKNQNVLLIGGDSNEIFVWIKKKDSKQWKLESSLVLSKDQPFIQCMELVYNPFLSESRNSRQSIANLKVLLNPIIAVGGGNNLYLVQHDMLTNKMALQCRYSIKDQKENEIHTILQCQVMGSYNYFVVGMEKGTMILFSYIISIDNTFTMRIEQIIKHHKECITSMELIGDQIFAVASNDRSISVWNFYNNKLKLLPIKLNRFWEDIPCIRQVYTNCFLTVDTSFNIIQWLIEDSTKVSILNSIQSNKAKIEIHEVSIIHNPENKEDFCLILLAKEGGAYKIIILDRYFQQVQSEILPQQFISLLINQKKKSPQIITNYKIGIINDSLLNKQFSSFADLKQSEVGKQNSNEKQQSFNQQSQMNLQKRVSLGITNNCKSSQHFIEVNYLIGNNE